MTQIGSQDGSFMAKAILGFGWAIGGICMLFGFIALANVRTDNGLGYPEPRANVVQEVLLTVGLLAAAIALLGGASAVVVVEKRQQLRPPESTTAAPIHTPPWAYIVITISWLVVVGADIAAVGSGRASGTNLFYGGACMGIGSFFCGLIAGNRDLSRARRLYACIVGMIISTFVGVLFAIELILTAPS